MTKKSISLSPKHLFVVLVLFVGCVCGRELLKFSDLSALGSSPSAIREGFKREYGINPDGISLNHETYYGAMHPAITEQYSRYCYKEHGSVRYTSVGSKDKTVIVGHDSVENRTGQEVSAVSTVTEQWTESVSRTTSSSIGRTFEHGVSIAECSTWECHIPLKPRLP